MGELFSLAFLGIFRKKRTNIPVFFVLLISFSFIIVFLAMTESITKTNAEFRLNTYGSWYIGIPNGVESDNDWLKSQSWVKELGISKVYGTIDTPNAAVAFGTINVPMLNVGRITVNSGHFPEKDNEIAMEADTLSALGYDYTLGQEIDLTVNVNISGTVIPVKEKYTLSGIIQEYSDLWVLEYNQAMTNLPSLVVTENAAGKVTEDAIDLVKSDSEVAAIVIPQYFVGVDRNCFDKAKAETSSYMKDVSRNAEYMLDPLPCINNVAYTGITNTESHNELYIVLIIIITIISVFSIYLINMPDSVHSLSIMRSIGAEKSQLLKMLIIDTLFLCIPAVGMGLLLGPAILKMMLKIMMYSGSVKIVVNIPYKNIISILLSWFLSVLSCRFIIFLFVSRNALVGRMNMISSSKRRLTKLLYGLSMVLTGAFGIIVIFTGLQSVAPKFGLHYYSECPSYTIYGNSNQEGKFSLLTLPIVDKMKSIPGIEKVYPFSELNVDMLTDGQDEQPVYLYILNYDDWSETFSLRESGIDKNKFTNGEYVILSFPKTMKEVCTLPDNDIIIFFKRGNKILLEKKAKVGDIVFPDENTVNRGIIGPQMPYTIIASDKFMKECLSEIGNGTKWDKFTAGGEYGYSRAYAMADLNSGFLSSDIGIASFCKDNNLYLENRREKFLALKQENLQKLIKLFSLGISISLVLILIVSCIEYMEAEEAKKRYTVLRAIGLSWRQHINIILRESLIKGIVSLIIGWLFYFIYIYTLPHDDCSSVLDKVKAVIKGLNYYKDTTAYSIVVSIIVFMVPFIITLLIKSAKRKGEEYI